MDVKFRVTRRRLMLAIAAAALVTAGGAGYAAVTADGGAVISACMLKVTGTIRLYDASAPANTLVSKPCNATFETAISWNQHGIQGVPGANGTNGTNGTNGKDGAPCLPTNPACIGPAGPAGKDGTNGTDGKDGAPCLPANLACVGPKGDPGVSVTSATLSPGDSTCPDGGSKFTAANDNVTYACNGKAGKDGTNGTSGSTLTKIEDLNGLACRDANGAASTVAVSVGADGALSLKCTTVVAPPPPAVTLTPGDVNLTTTGASLHPTFTLTNGTTDPITIDPVTSVNVASTTCGATLAGNGTTCRFVVNVLAPALCEYGSEILVVTGKDNTGAAYTVSSNINVYHPPIGGQLCP